MACIKRPEIHVFGIGAAGQRLNYEEPQATTAARCPGLWPLSLMRRDADAVAVMQDSFSYLSWETFFLVVRAL
jgi:hypothetical protein